jgi:DNA-binding Xre family transcriptional regulator
MGILFCMGTNTGRRARVAEEIRAEMARQQKTQVALMAATGLKRNTLHSRLNGRYPFRLEEVAAICRFLGVKTSDMIRRSEAD